MLMPGERVALGDGQTAIIVLIMGHPPARMRGSAARRAAPVAAWK